MNTKDLINSLSDDDLEDIANASRGNLHDIRVAILAAVDKWLSAPTTKDAEHCQYAQDVSMPEYRCVGKCQYTTQPPKTVSAETARMALEALEDLGIKMLEKRDAAIAVLRQELGEVK